ncbi:MAG TPA: VRR-NUC domain-containing protein [Candidatus Aphodomonas merdavium]|nr:VRR-NUC domain-containing protein [Candidatus Aphodomonas merdavium]
MGRPEGKRILVPSESVEQRALMQWAAMQRGKRPELALLYHIPNEGKRSAAQGARMRAEGLRAGVPDLCLPVARGKCHGLYIEMKRIGGKATPEQLGWLDALRAQGYAVAICQGWESAANVIESYLKEGKA